MALDANLVTLIGILTAALQVILLALAGFVAWFQLRETAKSRYLEGLVRIFDDFGSHAAYADADTVLGLPLSYDDFTPGEVELAAWVVRVYEKIGFLVKSGMIPESYLVPLYSRRIVWTWDAVQPYVAEQRRLRDSGGAYRMAGDGMYFEYLAARALAYRKRAFRGKTRVNPPVPEAYRERLREALATGQDVAPQLMR